MRIALLGKAGSGKTTIANALETIGFKKISLADPVKEIASKYFGMQGKDRALLQSIGQKMNEIDPEVWIKYACNQVKDEGNVVIDDMRRGAEYSFFVRKGFIPVRVIGESLAYRLKKRDGQVDEKALDNPVEHELDYYSAVRIDNEFWIAGSGAFEHWAARANEILDTVTRGAKYLDIWYNSLWEGII